MHRVVPQPGRLLPLLPLLPRHPSSVACARPRPRRRPTRDRQLSPPGSALCISVVRIGSHGWDETRQEETRRDETRRMACIEQWQGIFASSHPRRLSHPHPAWPDSPLPGAALVAAPLDEHVGSRINYSLPGSRRPWQPSALWPSRSCPGARLAYPAPALPCPALPCPGRLYTMAHVSPQLHLAQHGSGSMATLPRPRRP
jgi:hypothetical protein